MLTHKEDTDVISILKMGLKSKFCNILLYHMIIRILYHLYMTLSVDLTLSRSCCSSTFCIKVWLLYYTMLLYSRYFCIYKKFAPEFLSYTWHKTQYSKHNITIVITTCCVVIIIFDDSTGSITIRFSGEYRLVIHDACTLWHCIR